MKKIIILFFAFFIFFFMVSCANQNDEKLLSIEIDTTLIDEGIKKEDFRFDLIKIKAKYEDRVDFVNLEKEMVENFTLEDLEVGIHNLVINYKGKKGTFFLNIIPSEEEKEEDIYYDVVFIGFDGEILEIVKVKENEYLNSPIEAPEVDGYVFIDWNKTFPLQVSSLILVEPIYEKIELLKDAADYLNDYFSDITYVNNDINLPTNYEDVEISWQSSDENRLSSDGKYKKDYEEKKVSLVATLSYGNETMKKRFSITVEGYKSLKSPIASTYLYRNYDKLTEEFFDVMDIVYCAFVPVDENGNYKTNNALNNMARYVIPRAKEEGIYVIPSIGGGDSSAANIFSKIASSETKRKNFAKSMVEMINKYGFDGVDIDWEAPTSSEKENFTLLMKELYTAVKNNNHHHLVTAAIGGGKWYPPRYDLANSINYMDYVNMMLYSMCSSSGQYQNSLYKSQSKNDPVNGCGYTLTSCSFEESIQIYNNLGVSNDKLILGLAFYGQKQTKTDGEYKGSGSVFYTNIKSNYLNNPNYKYVFDEKASVPYLISLDGNTFISYDDPRSIKAKSEYVIRTGCAGLMTWEWGCDLTGDLTHAMKEGLGK